ncbi:hypothetical protein [Lysobacter capsici]|uniref:hypothetical protein n=1 Tax=Lysobacter capsici TaxID=435897 RepID=UPI00287B60B0|nr:hypothetical protein [Lysobacter capsici]WND79383.1 hypothetical protein RJ610_19080 [Lysobacter capsici]WND84579.1 hypothetical protein RJ609_19095 [Lysobacter capsici]
MPWGVAVAAVGAYASSSAQKKAAKAAAGASQQATDQTVAEQRRQYDQSRADQLPFLQAGQGALKRQEAYLTGDTSGFENSADYKFAVDQGFKGLNRGLARNGALWSGGGDADRIALGQGLATQYGNNYWNKLAGQAGQGQLSANTLGGLGANMANNIGTAYGNNALAQSQSAYNRANANSALYGQATGAFNEWYGGKNKSLNGGFYLGNQPGKG